MTAESTHRRREALLNLLNDNDPKTVALVKQQLVAGGVDWLPELRAMDEMAEALASFHLRDVITHIEEHTAEQQFMLTCRTFGEHGPLEEAVWELNTVLLPGEDFSTARARLDEWGEEVRCRLSKAQTAEDRVETISEYLNLEQRLRGDDEDYYQLRNSLLPAVIKTRLGIPISLSLVYMLVGERAGLKIDGVGLPGHFIVKHEDVFFDPFNGGRRVGIEDCRSLLEQQNLVLVPEHLMPATPRQMLLRMLTNIYYLAEPHDPPFAAKVNEWIVLLRKS